MSEGLLRIANGIVHDPANGVDGIIADVWIEHGRIVPPVHDRQPDRTLDAAGLVVMPGGVDMHTHVVGPAVNLARQLTPEQRIPHVAKPGLRSGTNALVPSSFTTGYLYAGLGYTTAIDAAVPPLFAPNARLELRDLPLLDAGFLVMVGNNRLILELLAANDETRLRDVLGWLLHRSGGYGLKLENPGGVELWQQGARDRTELDSATAPHGVTPRRILTEIARQAMAMNLPHAVHIHGNNLGLPGNWTTTRDTIQALDGLRAHLTHIQFHSYGGDANDSLSISSRAAELAELVNRQDNVTVDVGQVLFGDALVLTGDTPLADYLHRMTGRKWGRSDVEVEAGCGVLPIVYKDRSLVNALQWAIGLEWYLLIEDPWKVAMSTDHPNGGAFVAYPEIVQLLMDRNYRREMLSRLPERVTKRCRLQELDREYTLQEIAIITRAGPARILGLAAKGHLGPGADADVTIYEPSTDRRRMFSLPRYVLKGGEIVVENGEVRSSPHGRLQSACPAFDPSVERTLEPWFSENYSIRAAHYGCVPH